MHRSSMQHALSYWQETVLNETMEGKSCKPVQQPWALIAEKVEVLVQLSAGSQMAYHAILCIWKPFGCKSGIDVVQSRMSELKSGGRVTTLANKPQA